MATRARRVARYSVVADVPRFTHLSLLALSAVAGFSCEESPTSRSIAAPPASQAAPAPSASAPPLPKPSESSSPTAEARPYEVRPAVQVKHRVAGSQVLAVTAEPGVLLGPKKQLVKAFDCTSPGTARADMFGICVGFKSCEAVEPARAEVLAEIACKGPELTLELLRQGARLGFVVTDPNHPLAKRAMTPLELPAGTRPEILPFERLNLTNYVDL